MIQEQILKRDIRDERVIAAMRKVPRHLFMDPALQDTAYADHPAPIGKGQTISQPYIVAYMLEQLALKGNERVLEIGTGSGYQTALLACLGSEIYSIEIIPELHRRAQSVLESLNLPGRLHLLLGDGSQGRLEAAPFDAILVSACAGKIPESLKEQLAPQGRMILPLGDLRSNACSKFDPTRTLRPGMKKHPYAGYISFPC